MEENKYHRQIPPEAKSQAIQSVWTKTKTVKQVCQELAISKETYYKWERKAKLQINQAVVPQKPGRHPLDHVPPEQLNQELARLKQEIQKLKKETKQLLKTNEHQTTDLKIARIVIEDVFGEVQCKKNFTIGPKIN